MHVRAMDPGSGRVLADVYGRAFLGALTKAEMVERLVDEVGHLQRVGADTNGTVFGQTCRAVLPESLVLPKSVP